MEPVSQTGNVMTPSQFLSAMLAVPIILITCWLMYFTLFVVGYSLAAAAKVFQLTADYFVFKAEHDLHHRQTTNLLKQRQQMRQIEYLEEVD